MNIKIICLFDGIPLWSAAYPEIPEEQNSLLSGFLSAINTFAKMTEGTHIKNMTIGNYLWTFVNVHGLDDLFIVSEIELTGDPSSKTFKISILERLVSELLTQFSSLYPKEFFTDSSIRHVSAYKKIQEISEKRVKEYHQILERYESSDVQWLAGFNDSDRIFTALLNNAMICITGIIIDDMNLPDEFIKFQATIEYVSGHPFEKVIHVETSQLRENDFSKLENAIYLIDDEIIEPSFDDSILIIDLTKQNVISGPESDAVAKRVVQSLKTLPPGEEQARSLIQQLNTRANEKYHEFEQLITNQQNNNTEINCRICDTAMQFNTGDSSSYVSKKAHGTFFGMDLQSYRIAHFSTNQMHVNDILVDDKGAFHGIIDAYVISLNEMSRKDIGIKIGELSILTDGKSPIWQHKMIETMFILDTKMRWLMEIICPTSINSLEIGVLLLDKTSELLRIYSIPPTNSTVSVGDKQYNLWISGSTIIAIDFKECIGCDVFKQVISMILEQGSTSVEWLAKRERLNLVIKYAEISRITKSDVPIMMRIMTDDLIFSIIQVKFPDQIPRIVDRLSKEFAIAKDVLEPLLSGKTRIIDLLEGNYLKQATDLIELVDYINRRNIIK
ncbi:MAG TPA: hypothetical protein VKM55_00830 [Candidatus Lokiarchaeia archaeon]|nr:hypothetical protein [Candidatus Lokiarchaeia archaeon]